MGKYVENEVRYYYDYHSTEEDLMGETAFHAALIQYLLLVLQWLFRGQRCAIYNNLNFYQTANPKEYPIAPDIAVIKDVDYHVSARHWRVGKSGPAPQVVFEIASEETWEKDLHEKPAKYAAMGVIEYFAYDPNEPPVWRKIPRRLKGWRFNPATREQVELVPDAQGCLWSEQLASLLVPNGSLLQLYDSNNRLRLTGEEARAQEALAFAQEAAVRAQEARAFAQEAAVRAREVEALKEKLRALGVNPDEQ